MRMMLLGDWRCGAFSAKSACLRSAAPIEGSSGSRRQTCLNVLMTLMRWGFSPLKLPPPESDTFNIEWLTFSPPLPGFLASLFFIPSSPNLRYPLRFWLWLCHFGDLRQNSFEKTRRKYADWVASDSSVWYFWAIGAAELFPPNRRINVLLHRSRVPPVHVAKPVCAP